MSNSISVSGQTLSGRYEASPLSSSSDLDPPKEAPVSVREKILFFVYVASLVLTQVFHDVTNWRFYRPILCTDLITHYMYLPSGRKDPRLLSSGPGEHISIRVIPKRMVPDYEDSDDLDQCITKDIINTASNNYGGFASLEDRSVDVLETSLRNAPFCPAPAALEERVRKACASYMSADACVTTPSGFSANLLAYRTVATLAESMERRCVFLCDRDCHNSMFTGAYMNKNARVHKFNHNDIGDLEYKLRTYRARDPTALICVAVEGIYSMEGSISPSPAILALKQLYKFILLLDEAHSFMAVGSGGRGSFEYWQDQGYECSLRDVDIMTCMFSKSIGCTGGFVVANGLFATELERQGHLLEEQGVETLSTVVLVRVLSILQKPLLIESRMRQIQLKSTYVVQRLASAGCQILSYPGSAIICFTVGSARQASNFHVEALKQGIAIVCGVPPATAQWACRVRLCVFATSKWNDIHRLVNTVVSVCCKLRIHGVRMMHFDDFDLPSDEDSPASIVQQSEQVDSDLCEYILSLRSSEAEVQTPLAMIDGGEVISAGVAAVKQYGVGPCSARWFYGSFDIFITLEQQLAKIYPSLVRHAGRCRAMICGDAEVTIASTLTACAVPHSAKDVINLVLVSNTSPLAVKDGAVFNRATKQTRVVFYDNFKNLGEQLNTLHDKSKYYVTFYLQTVQDTVVLDLKSNIDQVVSSIGEKQINGVSVLLDDRYGLGKIGPRYLGYLDLMESKYGDNFFQHTLGLIASRTTVLVAGSWYNSFGHQGGYVTGTATAIEGLTVNAKAFLFSTPPMPLQAAMSNKALELLSQIDPAYSKPRL